MLISAGWSLSAAIQRKINLTESTPLRKRLARRLNEYYTVGEEIANGITHGIGVALSVAGLVLLVSLAVNRGDPRHVISFTIYGTSLLLLYLASTLYHSLHFPSWRILLRKFDHACIYILIAGTYTPFLLLEVGGRLGLGMLAIIWGIALAGITFKFFFINRFEVASVLAYMVMGWLSVIFYDQMLGKLPPEVLYWLAIGGSFYTLGVVFFGLTRLPYNHAIWHLFVLGGSVAHFFAVLQLAPLT